jgi:serine/threonine protein kinase
MGAAAPVHPHEQILQSFVMGKLDDTLATSVKRHLESCDDCRRRVAKVSSESFVTRLKVADGGAEPSGPLVSSDTWLSMLAGNASATAPPPADTLPPGLVDHADYAVIRELGQGGMGTVYLAKNRLMGRHEVLKVVSSHLIKRRGVMDRFLSEIRNAARLHHSNIVTAYSASRLGESIIFAMEYVDGLDLAKLIKAKGPFAVTHACNYIYQAALGLQHAHELGMVHRDIKPSNMILAPQGGRAVIKVLDFGLAKIQSEGAIDGGLTHEGQMLGTPDFVAPEQIGDARRADIRADIYSLGCTLYYLLTGGPPFKATSLYEILQAHHSMDALPLNLARTDVPMELAALVARMMAKEPELRFQTPSEVAQALKPFFKPAAAFESAKPELSSPGLSNVAGDVRAPALHPTTNVQERLRASKSIAHVPGAASMWERLVDLGEPEPLSDSPQIIAAPARPTRPRPMIIGLSILAIVVVATVAWLVGYVTKTKDQNVTVAPRTADRAPQSPNAKLPDVAVKEEPSHFDQNDASFESPAPVAPRDPLSSSSAKSDNRGERSPLPAEQQPSFNPPAPSAAQARTDTTEQPTQKPEQQLTAALPNPVARVLSPDDRLQQFGLKRAAKVYILAQEAEFEQKFKNSRSAVEDYRSNLDRRFNIQLASERIQQLAQIIPQLEFSIRAFNQQLGARPARPNSDQIAFFDEIKQQRDVLEQQRSEAITESQLLRNQLHNAGSIRDLDSAIQHGGASCRSAVAELGAMIRSIELKFGELKKDGEVQRALADAGGVKLAHTSEYQNIVKQIKQWEALVKSTTERIETKTEPVLKKNAGMRKR